MMRKKLLTALYRHSQHLYTSLFKTNRPWELSRRELLEHEPHTLGYQLGLFLEKHGFELIPKVERHDIYHVLTGYGIAVEDEIALQFLCLGNGKRSPYLFGAILIGTLILPEHLRHYIRSYRKGKRMAPFTGQDYRNLLDLDFNEFRQRIHSDKARETGFPHSCPLEVYR